MQDFESHDMNNDIIVTGAKIAIPLAWSHRHGIAERIKQAVKFFKIDDSTVPASLYFTMYAHFKSDYTLESINQNICRFLRNYKQKTKPNSYKFNDTSFTIFYDFTYSEYFYASNDNLDYDFEEDEIMIPSIMGVSMYLIPDINTSQQALDGHRFTEQLKKEILEQYDVKQMQSFVYIVSSKEDDLKKIFKSLDKKLRMDNVHIRNLSYKKNEVKIKLDALIAKNIGEIL